MRPNADTSMGDWIRGKVVEVTQDWLDANKRQLKPSLFVIEGAAYDLLNDGIPDSGWVKADIASWLRDKGVLVSNGYKTKSSLLAMVEDVLSPAPVEEVIVEAAPEIVEEITQKYNLHVSQSVEMGQFYKLDKSMTYACRNLVEYKSQHKNLLKKYEHSYPK